MKICSNCAASNVDSSEFCSECGLALSTRRVESPRATAHVPARPRGRIKFATQPKTFARGVKKPGSLDNETLAETLKMKPDHWANRLRRVDIVFILDCTESMGGEIDAIREVIISFVEGLNEAGLAIRVGLIEFRDRLINEEHRALLFDGQPFTSDPFVFQREARSLKAFGGGDNPESSLDAILLALRQPFDARAQKILVLITDAPPHIPDREASSVAEVAEAVRRALISQFYLIIPVREAQNQIYLHLCQGTRGIAFDLGTGTDFNQRAEDFKRTLLSLGKTISAATS